MQKLRPHWNLDQRVRVIRPVPPEEPAFPWPIHIPSREVALRCCRDRCGRWLPLRCVLQLQMLHIVPRLRRESHHLHSLRRCRCHQCCEKNEALDGNFNFTVWRKFDEQIGSRFDFEWLLPLEKCPIKTHRLSAILVDDATQDLEEKEKRLKRKIPLQYLGKIVMKLAQAFVEDIIQNAKH